MLGQVKKLVGTAGGGDIAGRFGAWWNGSEYVAPQPGEEGAEAAKAEDKPPKKAEEKKAEEKKAAEPEVKAEAKPEAKPEPKPKPEPVAEAKADPSDELFEGAAPDRSADPADVGARIKALETMWGQGRFAPGSTALDTQILDTVLQHADKLGGVGFIGADAALLAAFGSMSERAAHAAEWRHGCVTRLKQLAPKAIIAPSEVDRPRGFHDGLLEGVVSHDAFAYADHKPGLVAKVFRSLTPNGRWVFIETSRTTNKTPPEAFASAWAEPLLSTSDEIEELLKFAGFETVQKKPVTNDVLEAARQGYQHLTQVLEDAAQNGLTGREGALFLQEVAWEAQSWRARMRALEGGALEVNLWIADKGEPALELTQPVVADEVLDVAVKPDDAGAADALFDKGSD
ncbi:MAG: hypothetical protein Q8R02_14300 [Hyphomonadaceae bacterium]|nr:hypothetical protein [Hyphomonadaceae bacterium]